jgi:hypothetical protein
LRVRPYLAVLTVGMALALVAAAPAVAHKDGYCNLGDVCVHEHPDYGGGRLDYLWNDDDYRNDRWAWSVPGFVDNRVSSVRNFDVHNDVDFYRNPGYVTREYTVQQGDWVRRLYGFDNDSFSSHRFVYR